MKTMMTLKEFKQFLPEEYKNCSDEELEALLSFFHKVAYACLQMNKKKFALPWTQTCNKNNDTYSHHVYDTPYINDSDQSWWTTETTSNDSKTTEQEN